MADASVRFRTSAAAVLVVAVALVAGAFALVFLVRDSLRDGLETTAEQRLDALVQQIETTGLPAAEEEDDDLRWRVTDGAGQVVRGRSLPTEGYVVVTDDAGPYEVAVAVSLEEVDDSTEALITPLAVGLPLVLALVGGTTWVLVGRALAPVERIRREVEEITGDRLDRRVPEPASRDEISRLARTMNHMLVRLQQARDRQRQFVADASHELRSPVASIRQVAEVSRTHPGALPEGDLADVALAESARLQRLVDQLLLLTRADSGADPGPLREVDLDDLALAEAKRVGADASGVGAGRVRGDAAALGQVVRNLVDNAARHAAGRVAVAVRDTGDGVELVVEDDGHGIPEADRERVFERFVRLDEARDRDAGGSGLGLAIVREIVTAHGGTVAISSSPALGGARVQVSFRDRSAR